MKKKNTKIFSSFHLGRGRAVSGLDATSEARGILVSLACCARPSQGLPGVCGVLRLTAQTMGLERLRRKHQGPEWVDWPIRQLGALSSRITACGGDPEGSRHLLPAWPTLPLFRMLPSIQEALPLLGCCWGWVMSKWNLSRTPTTTGLL